MAWKDSVRHYMGKLWGQLPIEIPQLLDLIFGPPFAWILYGTEICHPFEFSKNFMVTAFIWNLYGHHLQAFHSISIYILIPSPGEGSSRREEERPWKHSIQSVWSVLVTAATSL